MGLVACLSITRGHEAGGFTRAKNVVWSGPTPPCRNGAEAGGVKGSPNGGGHGHTWTHNRAVSMLIDSFLSGTTVRSMADANNTQEAKEVEFYSAQVTAWLNTRFEHDKSLLTLSAGGIGLLITVSLATGFKSTAALAIYCAALFSFVICLACVLWIFRRNAVHLENVVCGREERDPMLSLLDKMAIASFMCGVLLASMLGVSAAVDSLLERKEKEMSDQKKKVGVPTFDSVNGISQMSPQLLEKSLNGISNMRPAPQPAQQPAPQPQPSPAPQKNSEN